MIITYSLLLCRASDLLKHLYNMDSSDGMHFYQVHCIKSNSYHNDDREHNTFNRFHFETKNSPVWFAAFYFSSEMCLYFYVREWRIPANISKIEHLRIKRSLQYSILNPLAKMNVHKVFEMWHVSFNNIFLCCVLTLGLQCFCAVYILQSRFLCYSMEISSIYTSSTLFYYCVFNI